MNKFDLSDNQFWILVWAIVALIIISIGMMINNNSKTEMKIEQEQVQKMMQQGYVQVDKNVCVRHASKKVWVRGTDEDSK